MSIPGDSFTFGTINSLTDWGIKVIAYDMFSAPKRERKQQIPFRSGSYDYGQKWYDDKIIRLDCATETRELSKSDMREVIYRMSRRNKLILWDETDKYYMGEMFESADIVVLPRRVKQQFTLTLVCDPFAYKSQVTQAVASGINRISYIGTAETPTLLLLKNSGTSAINNLQVTVVIQEKR